MLNPTPFQKFTDFKPIRVGPKRSVQLPSDWKNRLSGPYYICRGQEDGLPCIQVIPQVILHGKPPEFDGKDCQFGTRTRLTLSRDLCEEVGIQAPGSVLLEGSGCWFEFWSSENFDDYLKWVSRL